MNKVYIILQSIHEPWLIYLPVFYASGSSNDLQKNTARTRKNILLLLSNCEVNKAKYSDSLRKVRIFSVCKWNNWLILINSYLIDYLKFSSQILLGKLSLNTG